jgi:hypothetical protein
VSYAAEGPTSCSPSWCPSRPSTSPTRSRPRRRRGGARLAEIIAYCSSSFTLEAGDVLLTGTPWGCGAFADPPRFLHPGDVVEVEVDGIGTLENRSLRRPDERATNEK